MTKLTLIGGDVILYVENGTVLDTNYQPVAPETAVKALKRAKTIADIVRTVTQDCIYISTSLDEIVRTAHLRIRNRDFSYFKIQDRLARTGKTLRQFGKFYVLYCIENV